ncbi:MAG: hypothetical protein IJS15_14730 [Victivallales bacterium]|nr:hypothetical protein [Victivallales bacterium]
METHFDQKSLDGWYDVALKSPPSETHARIVEEEGRAFLMTSDHRWAGLSCKFKEPVTVDGSFKSITIFVRQKQAGKGFNIGKVAISSRELLDIHNGKAFAANKDSGFTVTGHISGINSVITARLDGRDDKTIRQSNPTKAPFFKAHNTWTDWRIIYDNEKKEISVTVDGASEPTLTLHAVDFTGVTFRSIWINQMESAYESIKVVTTLK